MSIATASACGNRGARAGGAACWASSAPPPRSRRLQYGGVARSGAGEQNGASQPGHQPVAGSGRGAHGRSVLGGDRSGPLDVGTRTTQDLRGLRSVRRPGRAWTARSVPRPTNVLRWTWRGAGGTGTWCATTSTVQPAASAEAAPVWSPRWRGCASGGARRARRAGQVGLGVRLAARDLSPVTTTSKVSGGRAVEDRRRRTAVGHRDQPAPHPALAQRREQLEGTGTPGDSRSTCATTRSRSSSTIWSASRSMPLCSRM